ncbi:hypothetical protein PV328_003208 [Microctonus aethiopoides]|uniref:Uncharacterized protein n=1 Tax=Microctonus aethiopoides TaxID=144406 RepID=A0AA39F7X9_9HYME|nr:hypothetical protein PV328_003208 [Microctonus aethiopoides]
MPQLESTLTQTQMCTYNKYNIRSNSSSSSSTKKKGKNIITTLRPDRKAGYDSAKHTFRKRGAIYSVVVNRGVNMTLPESSKLLFNVRIQCIGGEHSTETLHVLIVTQNNSVQN